MMRIKILPSVRDHDNDKATVVTAMMTTIQISVNINTRMQIKIKTMIKKKQTMKTTKRQRWGL